MCRIRSCPADEESRGPGRDCLGRLAHHVQHVVAWAAERDADRKVADTSGEGAILPRFDPVPGQKSDKLRCTIRNRVCERYHTTPISQSRWRCRRHMTAVAGLGQPSPQPRRLCMLKTSYALQPLNATDRLCSDDVRADFRSATLGGSGAVTCRIDLEILRCAINCSCCSGPDYLAASCESGPVAL